MHQARYPTHRCQTLFLLLLVGSFIVTCNCSTISFFTWFPVWHHFRLKNYILISEVPWLQYNVTSGAEIHIYTKSYIYKPVLSYPIPQMYYKRTPKINLHDGSAKYLPGLNKYLFDFIKYLFADTRQVHCFPDMRNKQSDGMLVNFFFTFLLTWTVAYHTDGSCWHGIECRFSSLLARCFFKIIIIRMVFKFLIYSREHRFSI